MTEPERVQLDPYVRTIGAVDVDDAHLTVGVDYDSVVIFGYELPLCAAEEFAQLFVSAVWQAAQQKARMDGESHG